LENSWQTHSCQNVFECSGQTLTATTIFINLISVKSFMRYKPDDSPKLEKAGGLSVQGATAQNLFLLEIFA
jgi:hypothetical protein